MAKARASLSHTRALRNTTPERGDFPFPGQVGDSCSELHAVRLILLDEQQVKTRKLPAPKRRSVSAKQNTHNPDTTNSSYTRDDTTCQVAESKDNIPNAGEKKKMNRRWPELLIAGMDRVVSACGTIDAVSLRKNNNYTKARPH